MLPQRSRASMLALRLRRSLTTSTWPSQAAICKAVLPSKSILLTSIPSFNKSSTPLTSPLQAKNNKCIVASRFSGTLNSSWPWSGLLRIGSKEDCLPKLNLKLFLLGSSEDCLENCLLKDLLNDPVENWREIPRFSWFASPSIFIFLVANWMVPGCLLAT